MSPWLGHTGCTYHFRRAKKTTDRATVTMGPLTSSLKNLRLPLFLRDPRGWYCWGKKEGWSPNCYRNPQSADRRHGNQRKYPKIWVPEVYPFSEVSPYKEEGRGGKTRVSLWGQWISNFIFLMTVLPINIYANFPGKKRQQTWPRVCWEREWLQP